MASQQIIVAGTAGYAREVVQIVRAVNLEHPNRFSLLGVVGPLPHRADRAKLDSQGTDYLGDDRWLLANADRSIQYVIGIGSPMLRRRIVESFTGAGLRPLARLVHPRAWVGSDSTLGEGVVIAQGVIVTTGVVLGRHVHLNLLSTVGHDARLGDYVGLQPHASVSGNVNIGTCSLIGTSASVIEGLSVGRDSVVGAGACVTRDVPEGAVAKGVPARW